MTAPSKCATCSHLEVWPGVSGSRYLCGASLYGKKVDPFGKRGRYGWPCAKGLPPVKSCEQYREGMHYSRKQRTELEATQ